MNLRKVYWQSPQWHLPGQYGNNLFGNLPGRKLNFESAGIQANKISMSGAIAKRP